MPLHFLNLKSFHPANKANQRRLFIAEEQYRDQKKREKEALREYEREQELHMTKQLAELEAERNRHQVEMMRKRKNKLQQDMTSHHGVGSTEENQVTAEANDEKHDGRRKRSRKKKNKGSIQQANSITAALQTIGWNGDNDDDENDNITNEATQIAKEIHDDPTKSSTFEGQKKSSSSAPPSAMNFMYLPPPGLKAAIEKEQKEKEQKEKEQKEREEQNKLEQQKVPSRSTTTSASSSSSLVRPEIAENHNNNNLMNSKEKEDVNNNSLLSTSTSRVTTSDLGETKQNEQKFPQNENYFPQPITMSSINQSTDKKNVSKDKLSIVEKFPFLKNAPTQGRYTENVKVTHKPFGIELRDVRCMRCGGYGHTSGDRECPLKDFNPLDARRQIQEDPLTLIMERENALRSMTKYDIQPLDTFTTTKSIMADDNAAASLIGDFLAGTNDDDTDILMMLNKKERRLLKKKFKELKRRLQKAEKKEKQEKKGGSGKRKRQDSD